MVKVNEGRILKYKERVAIFVKESMLTGNQKNSDEIQQRQKRILNFNKSLFRKGSLMRNSRSNLQTNDEANSNQFHNIPDIDMELINSEPMSVRNSQAVLSNGLQEDGPADNQGWRT